jgi:phosphoglycolate phosphatase-like HAD superfamily hydrolase
MRLAALMGQPVTYVLTHDSIGVGEDGPTHQPSSTSPSARHAELTDLRPADANETIEAWKIALAARRRPRGLVLTRQNLPTIDRSVYAPASGVARGAYVLADSAGDGGPDVILMASGSEVQLVLAAHERLVAEGVRSRVVNMASFRLFERQDAAYRESVLPAACRCRLAVEAASASAGSAGSATAARSSASTTSAPRLRPGRSSSSSASPPTTSTRAPAPCWPARPPRSSKAQQHTRRSRRPRPRPARPRSFLGGRRGGRQRIGPTLQAIAFDLDGTLANTLALNIAAFQHAFLAATGRRFSAQEVCELCGASQEGVVRRVVPEGWRECLAAFHEYFEAHYDEQAVPYDGIAELLASVERRGLATAIVTGAGRRCVDLTLANLGLTTRFGCVITGSPSGPRKPEQLAELVAGWGVAACRVAYVGDFASDMKAAQAAGVVALGAAWDRGADAAALRAAGALAVFASVGELRDWLSPRA